MNTFQAAWSPTIGALLIERSAQEAPTVRFIAEQISWNEIETLHLLSVVDDWQTVEADSEVELVRQLEEDYWAARAADLAICLLGGLSDALEIRVLERVEEITQTHLSPDKLLDRLIAAPLAHPTRASELAKRSLGCNFSATAKLLDDLWDLQPLLRRFADSWLELASDLTMDMCLRREEFWLRLVREGILRQLLRVQSRPNFLTYWSSLLISEPDPSARVSLTKIGNHLAERLFPSTVVTKEVLQDDAEIFDSSSDRRESLNNRGWQAQFESALKQVNAIARAVASGHDIKARKFLRELIAVQARSRDTSYAVKSLCNIAQRCAEMYRVDFERECLERALGIDAGDAWLQIQWGDHLKRTGQFAEGIRALEAAGDLGESIVAISSTADIWAQQGEFCRAISTYQKIPNWNSDARVRIAIADVYRRQGSLEEAKREYDNIITIWPDQYHAFAGKAEIAKRQGSLSEALELYDKVLQLCRVRDRVIYSLSKCHVLKLLCRHSEAYQITDGIIQEKPFMMQARLQRAALLGLLGNAQKGLTDLRIGDVPPVFGDWLLYYFRGLLLLKLDRFEEAKEQLIRRTQSSLRTKDDDVLLRLGAALAFLIQDNMDEADRILATIPVCYDYYTKYLTSILRLHVSVRRADSVNMKLIEEELLSEQVKDSVVQQAVFQLVRGNLQAAIDCEFQLLFRAA